MRLLLHVYSARRRSSGETEGGGESDAGKLILDDWCESAEAYHIGGALSRPVMLTEAGRQRTGGIWTLAGIVFFTKKNDK